MLAIHAAVAAWHGHAQYSCISASAPGGSTLHNIAESTVVGY
jgi:hypothetical protein